MATPTTPTAEVLCGGDIWTSSEFQGGLTGTCGPTSLSMAEGWGLQKYVPLADVFKRMRSANRCDANGVSTLASLRDQARADGFTTKYLPYAEPMAESTWRGCLLDAVPDAAVVLQVARGQQLVDAITGQGEDALGLRYHFIVVFGYHPGGYSREAGHDLPAGWWCGDGASNVMNPVVNGQRQRVIAKQVLVFYPEPVLRAAAPCGALAVYPKVTIPARKEGTIVPISLSQAQVAHYYRAGAGNQWVCTRTNCRVQGSILDFYRAFGPGGYNGLTYLGLPRTNELAPTPGYAGRIQLFERGALAFDPEHRWDAPPGAGAVYLAHLETGPAFDQLTGALRTQLQGAVDDARRLAMQAQAAADEAKKALAAMQAQAANEHTQLLAAQVAEAAAEQARDEAISTLAGLRAELDALSQLIAKIQQIESATAPAA